MLQPQNTQTNLQNPPYNQQFVPSNFIGQPVQAAQPPSTVVSNIKTKKPFPIVAILLSLALILALGSILTLFFLGNQKISKLDNTNINYLNQIEFQKNQKTQIRDIWENQAESNDKLIRSQDNLILQLQGYIEEVNKTVRFVDGKAQVLDTADEKRIKAQLENLNTELDNLNIDSQESIDLKSKNSDKISELYLKAFEDQSNRANPDGIRN